VALRSTGFAGQIAIEPAAGGSETLAAANQPAVENSLLAHPPVFDVEGLDANDPLNLAPRRFVQRYTQRYGSFSGLAPYASDALDLVAAAATKASSPTPEHIRDALEATGLDGIAGSYAFSPTNHGGLVGTRLVIFRCRQGRWVRES
jgi:branched-chain amino acid transport system substrate-binding protein